MTTVIIGAGAIGRLVAGRLAAAGRPAILLARGGAAALHNHGVTIQADAAVITARPTIVTADTLPAGPITTAILAVKGYSTAEIVPLLHSLRPALVISLQNGLGNEELLAASGVGRIIAGTITTSVEVLDETTIRVTKPGGVGLAALDAGPLGDALGLLAPVAATVRPYRDWRAMKWSKLLLNILGNATAALLGWSVAQVYAERALVRVERALFCEALATVRALGAAPVNLPGYPVVALAATMRGLPLPLLQPVLRRLIAGGRGGKPPSLALELARGARQTEAAQLYGAVAAQAAACGVAAPVNAGLARLLNAMSSGELSRASLQNQPAALIAALDEATILP